MPLRHAPFGIPKAELEQDLERRRRSHRRALAARQAALVKLREYAAALMQRSDQLAAEIDALKQTEQALLAELTPAGAKPDGPAPPDPLAELRETLAAYRTLQTEISAGVLVLIASFLKEGTAWTSTRRSG